jgi:hypothetical protein
MVRSRRHLVALAALVGCSGGGSGSFSTISGVITHNGTPVDGARVTLHSTVEIEGKRGTSYAGLTDSSGKYLIAAVGKELAFPGMYKVTITKLDQKGNLPPRVLIRGRWRPPGWREHDAEGLRERGNHQTLGDPGAGRIRTRTSI